MWSEQFYRIFLWFLQVDFFWINHSHNAFEWFTEILQGLEDTELIGDEIKQSLINVHLFVTGAPCASDIKAVALRVALEMAYKKLHKDVLSGLHSRIETGRPDWRKVKIFLLYSKCHFNFFNLGSTCNCTIKIDFVLHKSKLLAQEKCVIIINVFSLPSKK